MQVSVDSLTFLALSALAAILTSAAVIAWQRLLSKRRLKRFQNLTLVPNVLLTRHPILFISRSRRLFHMGGDFFELPIFLREHGYQVEEIEIRDRNLSAQETTYLIRRFLANPPFSASKVHLVLSEAFASSAHDLAFEGDPHLQSLTILGQEHAENGKVAGRRATSLRLTPPRIPYYPRPDLRPLPTAINFATELSALEHFVSLAESELAESSLR